ncbi:Hypothetical predicted protein, partial [Paramuricea clavata]
KEKPTYRQSLAAKDIKPKDKSSPEIIEQITTTTPREKSFSLVKAQLANIEAEFTMYRENNDQTMSQLFKLIEKKDEQINALKNDICKLKSTDKEQQQVLSDLTVEHLKMEQDIEALNKRCQKTEEKNLSLLKSLNKKEKESECEDLSWASMSAKTATLPPSGNTYTIPTSNSYEALFNEECENNTSNDTKKENKSQKPTPQTKNQEPENENPAIPPQNHTNTAETIILCDSNGRYLKPKLLCPNTTTSYIRCPTLTKARQIITTFTDPKNFILHCGTNDIEHLQPEQNLDKAIEDIVGLVKEKHPECRVIISGLLPRRDELNKNITSINNGIEKVLENTPNTSFIHHENISTEKDFYDNKHLNERGVNSLRKTLRVLTSTQSQRRCPI